MISQFGHAVLNLNFVRPAEAVQLADIDELAHGAVRLRSIKLNRAFKSYGLHNKL